MTIFIYSLRDLKGSFIQPHCDINDDTARRNFAYAVNNGNDIMGFAPQDFQLYKIAEFETTNGKINPIIPMELVADGVSVIGVK